MVVASHAVCTTGAARPCSPTTKSTKTRQSEVAVMIFKRQLQKKYNIREGKASIVKFVVGKVAVRGVPFSKSDWVPLYLRCRLTRSDALSAT